MHDDRFPFMVPLDGRNVPGLSASEFAEVLAYAKALESRHNVRAWFNSNNGHIMLTWRDLTITDVIRQIPYKPPGQPRLRLRGRTLRDTHEWLHLAQRPRWVKDHIDAKNKRERESEDARIRAAAVLEAYERTRDFRLRRARGRGMGQHYRPFVVHPGIGVPRP